MNFSSLLQSEFLLYVVGGLIVVVLIGLLVVIFSKKETPTITPVVGQEGALVSPVVTTIPVDAVKESLPSTDVIDQSPVVQETSPLPTEVIEPASLATPGSPLPANAPQSVPPLSVWKPSEEAAPLNVEDATEELKTIAQSVEGEVQTPEQKA